MSNGKGSSTIIIGDYSFPIDSDIEFPYMQPINNPKDFKHFLKIVKLLHPKETSEGKIINLISALLMKNKTLDSFDIPNAFIKYMNMDNSKEGREVDFIKGHSANEEELDTAIEAVNIVNKYGSKRRKVSGRKKVYRVKSHSAHSASPKKYYKSKRSTRKSNKRKFIKIYGRKIYDSIQ